jgi:tRNA(fMet)-specific endonuclease VapC
MLDTNILIYLIKNKPPLLADRVNALASIDELCMSFFTFAELRMGAELSTRKPEVLRRLDALIREVPVRYGVNRSLCEHYAVQFTRLRSMGTPIGGNDLWIACTRWLTIARW